MMIVRYIDFVLRSRAHVALHSHAYEAGTPLDGHVVFMVVGIQITAMPRLYMCVCPIVCCTSTKCVRSWQHLQHMGVCGG